MNNSLIFYKKSACSNFPYQNYDCCENLGRHLNDYSTAEAYIALPKQWMDPFFLEESNLTTYLRLIDEALDVHFEIEKELGFERFTGCASVHKDNFDQYIMVKWSRDKGKRFSNKHFNAAYNLLRYNWYQRYQNVAIIATNLFKLNLLTPVDVLALASSFQNDGTRALLPTRTNQLDGMLFFREKEEIIRNLEGDMQFNKAFYMYPIYFNPVVEIKGTFFSDAVSILEAKSEIGKLIGMDDATDIPPYALASLKSIFDEYLKMKVIYRQIVGTLNSGGYTMNFADSLLLSNSMKNVKFMAYNAIGSNANKYLNVYDGKSVTVTDAPVKTEPELKFAK